MAKCKSQYEAHERYIFSALRRIFGWTARKTALAKGKSGINKYPCQHCGTVCASRDIHVDHIDPVMPLTGWDGKWTEYIQRMFKGETQLLCKRCHLKKTHEEREIRKQNKEKKNAKKGT